MSALEQEIIERFDQLEPEAQQRIVSILQAKAQPQTISIRDVLAQADAVRVTLRPDANGNLPSTTELINEMREERDANLLRSLGFGDSASDSSN